MSEGVAYQNKDILFKVLAQTYKEKSFAAYGIHLPPIRELLPTNLPKISANEKDIDNLFLLEDGTYAIVDYEGICAFGALLHTRNVTAPLPPDTTKSP